METGKWEGSSAQSRSAEFEQAVSFHADIARAAERNRIIELLKSESMVEVATKKYHDVLPWKGTMGAAKAALNAIISKLETKP